MVNPVSQATFQPPQREEAPAVVPAVAAAIADHGQPSALPNRLPARGGSRANPQAIALRASLNPLFTTDPVGTSQSHVLSQEATMGLTGDLDQKMTILSQKFRGIFGATVGPEVFAHAQPILDLMTQPDAAFEDRMQLANAYINRYKDTNPQAIINLAKMIDCQLLVYGMVEDREHFPHAAHSTAIEESIQSLAGQCDNDPNAIRQLLSKMTVASVFTAHPTQLHHPLSILRLHEARDTLDDPAVLHATCVDLWNDSGVRPARPTVHNEAQDNVPYLQMAQREIRRVHKTIDRSIEKHAGPASIRPLVRIDSWIGGDRDGNVAVDAGVIKRVMAVQADVALQRYQDKLSPDKLQKTDSLRALLDRYAPGKADRLVRRIETTRQQFSYAAGETAMPPLHAHQAYQTHQQFTAELEQLHVALPDGAARAKLSRFIREVDGLGFHAASVDVRQNSSAHEQSVADLFRQAGIVEDYTNLSEEEKQTALLHHIFAAEDKNLFDPAKTYTPDTEKELAIFHTMRDMQAQYGERAMPNYIIANTENVSDLLEPLVLLKEVGLAGKDGLKMNIIPLIETVPDLKNGRAIVGDLLKNDAYRDWIKARDNTQQVMVGYSDSNRLDGPLASNWQVQKALVYLQDICKEYEVDLLISHGRGGTVARGAGVDFQQEIDSHPSGSSERGMRQTEQGEEIAKKFGDPKTAERSLHSMTAATIKASLSNSNLQTAQHHDTYHDVMEHLCEKSIQTYRQLMHDTPALVDYYNQATPVGYVSHLNAGSRAASRKTQPDDRLKLDQLRAIPWVAGWNQSRAMLPSWYGIGSSMDAHVRSSPDQPINPEKLQELQQMYQRWPFFKTLIDRTESTLAQADLGIVKHYAGLVKEKDIGLKVYEHVQQEFDLTKNVVLAIKQSDTVLQENDMMASGLKRKSSFLDTANALQIALLGAERSETNDEVKKELRNGIGNTMQAIQSGLGRFG